MAAISRHGGTETRGNTHMGWPCGIVDEGPVFNRLKIEALRKRERQKSRRCATY